MLFGLVGWSAAACTVLHSSDELGELLNDVVVMSSVLLLLFYFLSSVVVKIPRVKNYKKKLKTKAGMTKARFPLAELMGDRFPLPVNSASGNRAPLRPSVLTGNGNRSPVNSGSGNWAKSQNHYWKEDCLDRTLN